MSNNGVSSRPAPRGSLQAEHLNKYIVHLISPMLYCKGEQQVWSREEICELVNCTVVFWQFSLFLHFLAISPNMYIVITYYIHWIFVKGFLVEDIYLLYGLIWAMHVEFWKCFQGIKQVEKNGLKRYSWTVRKSKNVNRAFNSFKSYFKITKSVNILTKANNSALHLT